MNRLVVRTVIVGLTATGSVGLASADLPSYRYEALAYLGTRAPDGGAYRGAFEPGAVGSGADVAYVAGVGSRGAEGLFLDTPDAILAVVTPGAEAMDGWRFAEKPGPAGGIVSPVSMNLAGDLVFAADLEREDQGASGVFRWERQTGTLTALALPGTNAPDGGQFGNARAPAVITDSGAVAFAADVPWPEGAPAEGVFIWSKGEIRSIVRPGDDAPDGGAFAHASQPDVSEAGLVAFEAVVNRDGHPTTGIYLRKEESFLLIAETGSSDTGIGLFRQVQDPHLTELGEVVFTGEVEDAQGRSRWGVFRWEGGQVSPLVGPDSVSDDGSRIDGIVPGRCSLALNRKGGAAMLLHPAQAAGAAGVFLCERGRLWPVALPGTILVGVGPLDTVGACVALNDAGQVAFEAELADGEIALVLATPVAGG